MQLHWFLPTTGDGHGVVRADGGALTGGAASPRPPTLDYLALVAQAAEFAGFESVLTPVGTWAEDPWLTTAALLGSTRRLRFLVALRADAMSPTLAAQMAATYQRLSAGRLLLNVVTGGDRGEQHRFGDWLDHDERYARTEEFLAVFRGASTGVPFDLDGRYLRVAGATVHTRPEPMPPVFLGGSSDPSLRVSARYADVHLTWAEPLDALTDTVSRLQRFAAAAQRQVAVGVRVHVISRQTADEAWDHAERLLAGMDREQIEQAHHRFAAADSVGQRRMAALHGGQGDRLVVGPNLWAGIGLLRRGAGLALIGSHDQVADRLEEYAAVGIAHVILSAQPHLEEAVRIGEELFPVLRARGLLSVPPDLPAGQPIWPHRRVEGIR
ncbi:MAG: LLM class flavin-dependent oxidoreductase [Actinomycetota bacterium]|nr:MAG: LLM class flavin-dependent oxidoreductase [Actinomycetota bacterium]